MDHEFRIKDLDTERTYHNTAILIYLKAVRDILGNVDVRIGNSLNQGYFTYIDRDTPLTSTEIHKIWNRMERICEQDLEIRSETRTAAEAGEKWAAAGYREKAALMEDRDPDEEIVMSVLDGYVNCMYGRVLPSTGNISLFELRPYRQGLLLRLPNALHPDSLRYYRDDDKLYDAYADSKRMRNRTGINYLADLNKKIRTGGTEEVIKASEELHARQIDDFAENIISGGKRVVLIAGPSSSGKTTTAIRLCKAIADRTGSEPLYLGTDDYFVERTDTPLGEDGKPDFEGLGALDMKLFSSQMKDLLDCREVDIPRFDFVQGKKIFGERITTRGKDQIIVIEGIHSLNDVLTPEIQRADKYKIYISPLTQIGMDRHNRISTADARLLRRIVRDNQFRGYDAEATLDTWPKVRSGESVNIFPYSSSADVVFNSSTVYETNLLRTYAEPLLLRIGEDSSHYHEAQRILSFIRFFRRIDEKDAAFIPNESLIREFIGREHDL